MLFEMENYQEGDLTDIVRGRSKSTSSSSNSSNIYGCKAEDDQPFSSQLVLAAAGVGGGGAMNYNFSSSSSSSSLELQERRRREAAAASRSEEEEVVVEYSFGDPFCAAAAMRDPLLVHHHHLQDQELEELELELDDLYNNSSSSAAFFNNGGCGNLEEDKSTFGGVVHDHSQDEVMMIKRPSTSSCNIFSRMLQISPATTTTTSITNKFPILSDHSSLIIPNSNNSHHFLDNNINNPSTLQISSPRNPPGIKRRKSQARKVVCVPAPVAASSRPNGEVIPSDLWAWRKYGQKPIKGSPYPRGYYRCSSSKGCSARKQVERSRTDPNMLVITYTSEHNHPWPTQRNALAGSSRSQQSKNNTTPNSSKVSAASTKPTTTTQDRDQLGSDKNKEDQNTNNNGRRTRSSSIKEEGVDQEIIEKQLIETEDNGGGDHDHRHQFSEEGFQYRVAMNTNNNQSDDFFADLEELETDHPLNLLFTQTPKLDQISKGGCSGGGLDDVVAFNNLFNWGVPEESNNNNSSFDQDHPSTASKRGFY